MVSSHVPTALTAARRRSATASRGRTDPDRSSAAPPDARRYRALTHAIGYLRTSSARRTNVGEDKDSDKRQRAAILAGARRIGCEITDWFYDAGVSGDVEVSERLGFTAMLDRIEGNGVRTVIVESADRFARKMLTAELGILLLVTRGVKLMTAAGEDLTDTDDEMRVAFRQMAMTFAQLEKTRLVKKLRVARDRASQTEGGPARRGRKGLYARQSCFGGAGKVAVG